MNRITATGQEMIETFLGGYVVVSDNINFSLDPECRARGVLCGFCEERLAELTEGQTYEPYDFDSPAPSRETEEE